MKTVGRTYGINKGHLYKEVKACIRQKKLAWCKNVVSGF